MTTTPTLTTETESALAQHVTIALTIQCEPESVETVLAVLRAVRTGLCESRMADEPELGIGWYGPEVLTGPDREIVVAVMEDVEGHNLRYDGSPMVEEPYVSHGAILSAARAVAREVYRGGLVALAE